MVQIVISSSNQKDNLNLRIIFGYQLQERSQSSEPAAFEVGFEFIACELTHASFHFKALSLSGSACNASGIFLPNFSIFAMRRNDLIPRRTQGSIPRRKCNIPLR